MQSVININEIFGIPFFIMYLRKVVYILHYSISSQFELAAFQMPDGQWLPLFGSPVLEIGLMSGR